MRPNSRRINRPQRTLHDLNSWSFNQVQIKADIPIVKREKAPEKIAENVDISKIIKFSLDASYKLINNSKDAQEVPLMVTVGAEDVNLSDERLGLDLVIMIDTSGSMQGEKIKLVRKTLNFIVEQLNVHDRLSLITFNSNAVQLAELTPMTPAAKERFQTLISRRTTSRGSTNIGAALTAAFSTLAQRKQVNDLTAMFLLSDGEDTCGGNHAKFQQQLIYFDSIMQKAGMSYKINSYGYGSDHDEKLLSFLANYKEGSFYYIKSIPLISECFIDSLGYLMSVFGTQAEVSVYMYGASKIKKFYGNSWSTDSTPIKATLKIGNLAAGIERNYICVLQVPPTTELSEVKPCNAILNFVVKGINHTFEQSLNLQVSLNGSLGSKNQKVEINLIREETAEAMKEATQYYQKGNMIRAKQHITEVGDRLRSRGITEIESVPLNEFLRTDIFDNPADLYENNQILGNQAFRASKAKTAKRNCAQRSLKKAYGP